MEIRKKGQIHNYAKINIQHMSKSSGLKNGLTEKFDLSNAWQDVSELKLN